MRFQTKRQQPAAWASFCSISGVLQIRNLNPLRININACQNWSMDMSNDIRTGRHCVFKIHIHLVFIAKYRKCVFTQEALDCLRQIFAKVCQDFEAELQEFNGEGDHVHLLVEYPPKVAVSKLVNSLKGVSSRRLRQERPEMKTMYWKNMLWSPSYFAGSCGGAPIEILRQYIEQQKTPH